ncbi:hypothetical protein AVEN_275198-1 [Araneus ventricosus]|uniref:Uncharacterized protein n=1 Tax=Araneus ventricosus TaxID=182803 RepID=A0A4Y2NLV0_ARAVE|nr:hypothetical protein AVEN_275198-1 [Araneus ventricosus]
MGRHARPTRGEDDYHALPLIDWNTSLSWNPKGKVIKCSSYFPNGNRYDHEERSSLDEETSGNPVYSTFVNPRTGSSVKEPFFHSEWSKEPVVAQSKDFSKSYRQHDEHNYFRVIKEEHDIESDRKMSNLDISEEIFNSRNK